MLKYLEIDNDGRLEEEDEGGEHGAFQVPDAQQRALAWDGGWSAAPALRTAGIWGPHTGYGLRWSSLEAERLRDLSRARGPLAGRRHVPSCA